MAEVNNKNLHVTLEDLSSQLFFCQRTPTEIFRILGTLTYKNENKNKKAVVMHRDYPIIVNC